MADNDSILTQAAKRFRQAIEHDREEREAYDEDVRFAINDDNAQWDADVYASRTEDSPPRPVMTLNKIPEKIDQVEGEFLQLRPSAKVKAVDSLGDPKMADILGGMVRFIEYDNDAESAYTTAFTSTLYGGRGAWRYDVVDSEEDPFVREIRINRIPNPLTVVLDPFAKKKDKSDAQFCFVTEVISKELYEEDYKEGEGEAIGWPSEEYWSEWYDGDGIRIAEYWWKEKKTKKYYRVNRMKDGVDTIVTTEKLEDYEVAIDTATKDEVVVKWCKMRAGKIIEGPNDWPIKRFPIVQMLGKEVNVRGKSKSRGMPRFAKTPQQMYNYWSCAVTEQVALAPKAPYLVTASMIGPYAEQWKTAPFKNYFYLMYDIDPQSPTASPRREPPPAMSTALTGELARMDHDIMSAMGIYQAGLGDRGDEKSGKAILARQKQGNIGSYVFTNNFITALKYGTKVLLELIPKVYDTERIVRIVGEDGEEAVVPINARPEMAAGMSVPEKYTVPPKPGVTEHINDLGVGRYDVVVTVGPSYATLREESLAQLLDLIKSMPQVGAAIIDLVAENMDLPQSQKLVSRLKKLVPPDIRGLEPGEEPPQPPGPDPKLMLELQKLQIDMRDQMRKEFDSHFKAIGVVAQAEALEAGNQIGQYQAMVEHIHNMLKIQTDQQKAAQTPPQEVQGGGNIQG